MALHSTLGRSAARVRPVVTRLVLGQRTNYHTRTLYSVVKSQPSSNLIVPTSLSSLRRYYSAPSAASALKILTGYDRKLLKVIDRKIDYAEQDEDDLEVLETPYRFPFFIEDVPGKQTIILTRMRPYLQGETMYVEVDMLVESYPRLVVKVVKSPGSIVKIRCTAYPNEISIDSMSVTMPDSPDHENACGGSDFPQLPFIELDDELQKALGKYLEVRGINTSTANYLHEYMIRKRKRDCSHWLKKLQTFVQA